MAVSNPKRSLVRDAYTCIIPFYNESAYNVINTVQEVLKVKEIELIVVIDDGSENSYVFDYLRYCFKLNERVLIKKLGANFGKTFAVYHGLNYASEGNIFLCDSDLKNLNHEEISNAIVKFDLLHLDMLILRRMNIGFLPKIIRADTLLSGERILKKKDLVQIIQSKVVGYQLEVATNHYFVNKKFKRCYWSASSAVNNYKYKKFKFFKGIFKDLKMYYQIISFVGFRNYLKQISSFCKEDV
jgi:glycosyltransferase involved in cell wall biosynthesis